MEIPVNQYKVAGVVTELGRILEDKGFNGAEICLGVSEFLGRLVVLYTETPPQAQELSGVCKDHLERTIKIGFSSTKH